MRYQLPVFILLTFYASVSLAADPGSERSSVSLGVFITDRNTEARLDSESLGRGTVIDGENDLGLDSSDTVVRLDAYYRFNPRHRIDFSVFDLSRDATATIDRSIQFGDEIFDVNSTLSTDNDITIYKMAYTYSFMQWDKGYLGAIGGFYVLSSDISLVDIDTGQFESDGLTAPLPVIGLRGEYQLAARLSLRSSGELFAIEFDNVDGSLFDFYVGLDYEVSDKFSVGLGYNNVSLDVDVDGSDFKGALDWSYEGALLSVAYSFGSFE